MGDPRVVGRGLTQDEVLDAGDIDWFRIRVERRSVMTSARVALTAQSKSSISFFVAH